MSGGPSTAALVARYAARFHAALVDGSHTVTSPLGAWLLLALVAPAAEGEAAEALAGYLGTDPADAAARAAELLERPHPVVATAVAVWAETTAVNDAFTEWGRGLPPAATIGPVPTPSEADDWAREHTAGMIGQFPIDLAEAVLVVATALATRVRWETPLRPVPSSLLGGPWADRVARVLQAATTHGMGIAHTPSAGDVAVHAAESADGLVVVSVVAAPEVPPAAVLAAAHEVGPLVMLRAAPAEWRSLFDLPLGPGHAWSLREYTAADPDAVERFRAWLPAWSATSRHDLLEGDTGFAEALGALWRLVDPRQELLGDAVQAARAAYDAEGFEAAAITALGIVRGMPEPDLVETVREAELRFDRPYAVAAFTDLRRLDRGRAAPPWDALPVFAAWVAEPTEP